MWQEFSRRDFLAGLTAGGTSLALTPEAAAGGSPIGPAAASSSAVVQAVHPWVELKPAASPIRVLVAARLAPDELEKLRQAAPEVELIVPRDAAERQAVAPS